MTLLGTMGASRAEEEGGKMSPQPVEQHERMLGNNNGAGGNHDSYMTKVDGNMAIILYSQNKGKQDNWGLLLT